MKIDKYNPFTILLYFFSNILITMLTKNPIFILISFISIIIYSLILKWPSNIIRYILIILLVILISGLTNPVFTNQGTTNLFVLGKTTFTLEAIIYGVITAIMLISIVLWFRNYNLLITSEKFLYLTSGILPNIALIISMILKLIPEIIRKIKDFNEAQKVLGMHTSKGLIKRINNSYEIFGNVFSWTIEHSLNTAISMKARGYGLKNKTKYIIYKFRFRDIVFCLIILSITSYILFFNSEIIFNYSFYPLLSEIDTNITAIIGYLLYFILANLGTILHLKETIKWHYLQSKIYPSLIP